MQWTLDDRGFLPNSDPLERIYDRDFNYVEQLAKDLPDLVDDGKFQEYMTFNPMFDKGFSLTEFIDCENHMAVERAFMLFSYFASTVIHARDYRGLKHNRIPQYIARPLVRLAKAVNRPPILSYASYCLHNWRRINKDQPIELGNIELLQNFTLKHKKDEDWFILVHVDIEARANEALKAISEYRGDVWKPEVQVRILDRVYPSLVAMNAALDRMPEGCSPDVYYAKVRPYIFGFTNVVYEGCFDGEPQNYRGETGAQSSIIPTLLRFFGIQHQDSMLTRHLTDMQDYMPLEHVRFMDDITCIRTYVTHNQENYRVQESFRATEMYNACLEQIIKFRQTHFDYAVNYIEKKVDNPIATGGTPYVKWLGQLIEETKTFFINNGTNGEEP